LHVAGAIVIHGDWNDVGGRQVDEKLHQDQFPAPSIFVKTDVTDYESVLNLFDIALSKFGRVDIAISNAGLQEAGNWFDPSLDIESIRAVSTFL